MKRIAVMTSGGDAPGMNAAVRSVVRAGLDKDVEVYGIRQAYQGLLSGDIALLTSREVSGILQRGGTILQTSRNEEFKTLPGKERRSAVLANTRSKALLSSAAAAVCTAL